MSRQAGARSGLSFFGMIGLVMTALKLKQNWDESYKPVSDEDEGRVALANHTPYRDNGGDDEAQIGLLDTGIPVTRPKRKRSGCCVCCGINCSLFWKAFAIVCGGLALWYSFKLIRWAVTDAPTGLELMPAYSTSLGCLSASHIYNSSQTVVSARMGSQDYDHTFDVRGSAVGTFVVAQGAPDSKDIKYEMTIRADTPNLLQDISIHYPETDDEGAVTRSRLLISTPWIDPSSSSCMRYDIKMYVPPALKKLHVQAHTPMHLQFDPNSNVELNDFFVTMFATDKNNMILPHENLHSDRMALEVTRGWIVGDVAIVNSTSITTQRGDGVANIRAHPTVPVNTDQLDTASLRTTTGAGRTDIYYITPKAFKRPINNVHMSSGNGDMYLTYRAAEYSGRIELESRSYTATGIQSFPAKPIGEENSRTDKNSKWTHWAGDKDGQDRVYIKSRGWTGLYF